MHGTAVSLNAAAGLALDCGLAPDEHGTLASLLHRCRRPDHLADTIVVVDEASMLATRDAAQLLTALGRDGGRILLVGDPDQAPPVQAGRPLDQLIARTPGGVARLRTTVRQVDPDERATVDLLRDGHTTQALTRWAQQGRVEIAPHQATLHRLAAQAAAETIAGRAPLVLTATRNDAAELAALIRSRLLAGGHLPGAHHRYGLLEVTPGDRVILRRNDYKLRARDGAVGVVTTADAHGADITLDDGTGLRLPAAYLERHVAWAYATNVHPAQGQTADHVHVLVTPALHRPLALVAGSRHRHTVSCHITAGDTLEHLRGPDHPTTFDEACPWMAAVRRSGALTDQELSADIGRAAPPAPRSTPVR